MNAPLQVEFYWVRMLDNQHSAWTLTKVGYELLDARITATRTIGGAAEVEVAAVWGRER